MEISDVRNRIHLAMERAKRRAAERREHTDASSRAFETFLAQTAAPLFRQIANVLKADSYRFSVSTPSGSVRLMSDTSAEDFIELSLDTSGDRPRVIARTSHSRGRRVVDAEQVVGSGDPATITEEELFAFLLGEIEPFVER